MGYFKITANKILNTVVIALQQNKTMQNERKEIKLKRALILGNFYNKSVRIVKVINEGYETIVDTIVGLKQDLVLTKGGLSIPKASIKTIYQL